MLTNYLLYFIIQLSLKVSGKTTTNEYTIMNKFLFNSGLYETPFFTKHKINFQNEFENIYMDFDNFIYSYEIKYHQGDLNENLTDEEKEEIQHDYYERASWLPTVFEPIIFNEKIALECGLIPFTLETEDETLQLLALGGCGMNLSPRLDAYQFLTHNTIDKNSLYFTDQNYFKNVVGESITNQIKRTLQKDNPMSTGLHCLAQI